MRRDELIYPLVCSTDHIRVPYHYRPGGEILLVRKSHRRSGIVLPQQVPHLDLVCGHHVWLHQPEVRQGVLSSVPNTDGTRMQYLTTYPCMQT